MSKLLYVIGLCSLISSCGLFSTNKHYSYIKEQENPNLMISANQKKDLVFENNYDIGKIPNTTSVFYPDAPPRPNSQLEIISKTGAVYTWNRKDNNNWIDTTQTIDTTIKQVENFLIENNIKIDKTRSNSNMIATKLEGFYYTTKSKGILGKLQKQGLAVRTKDEVNYEGRYIITIMEDKNSKGKISNLKIRHESIALNSKDKQIIALEDSDREMSNDLLKKLWLYFSNKI